MNASKASLRSSRLALRVGGAFSVVLLLFVLALVVTQKAFSDISEAESEVARLDHAKHAGHAVAALVREQYRHQAHTVITRSEARMRDYTAATDKVREATDQLIEAVPTTQDRDKAKAVAGAADEVDCVFRQEVLPALHSHDEATLLARHQDIERHVAAVADRVQALNHDLEARARVALERAKAVRAQAQLLTLVFFALAMLAAGLLGGALMRSIARPVDALRAGAQRIAQGDLGHQIEWASPDELGDLARTFNRMSADLATHQRERLRTQRLQLLGQVTAGVAHELNNPIGVILGYLKLIRRDGQVTPERIDILEDEARQSQRIVQDLLQVARPSELEPETLCVQSLIQDVVDRLTETNAAPGVRLHAASPAGPEVWADGPRLRQVLKNLIVNAVDVSPPDGTVTITVKEQDGAVCIRVQDEGPGVPTEAKEQIFDPFFTTKSDGTGLGLALSRSLVEAHGGSLDLADSDGGAAFVITLAKA